MGTTAENFRNHIIESRYVLDPEGTHHEFVSGLHGRKLDFDLIPDGSELFHEWVDVAAKKIRSLYLSYGLLRSELLVISVANGTNRVVGPVAQKLRANSALTEKDSPRSVKLTPEAEELIAELKPSVAVVLEDVGTSGTTSATAVEAVRSAGVQRVEALNTWQRREKLEKLIGIKAAYSSIIYEPLPTYTPEDCQTEGYCAQNWEFIPRSN